MGERIIPSKFNVHENYKRVNIINPYRYASGGGGSVGSYEPETIDYMGRIGVADDSTVTIYGITQHDVWVLCNDVIKYWKTEGVLSTIYRMPLMYGNTIDTLEHDLLTNTIFNFFGSWVFDETGLKGNGTNTYANLGNSPNSKSVGLTICVASDNLQSGAQYEMGMASETTSRLLMGVRHTGNLRILLGDPIYTQSVPTAAGVSSIVLESGSAYGIKNQATIVSGAVNSVIDVSIPLLYGAGNISGNPSSYSNQKMLSAAITTGTVEQTKKVQFGLDMWEAGLNRKTW